MPFSEKDKKDVREKAAFRCCRCQKIGIEIHHIIPQEYEGSDAIENAAPLCPSCHSDLGGNPEKRKEITHMRDWWYKQVEKMLPFSTIDYSLLEKINEKIDGIRKDNISELKGLKDILKSISNETIDKITSASAEVAATGIVNTSSASIFSSSPSATKLGKQVYANFLCNNCGTSIGLLIGSNKCPHCGAAID